MTLHIVNQSPFAGSALSDCLNAFNPGDALLLIEDATYGANDQRLVNLPAGTAYCLAADALARGINTPATVTSIDDARWVVLCTEHNPIVSWFR